MSEPPLAMRVTGATPANADTGTVVSATWDASLLTDTDGSSVELRVVGHASSGDPGDVRTVEVGAVDWNATLNPPSMPGWPSAVRRRRRTV